MTKRNSLPFHILAFLWAFLSVLMWAADDVDGRPIRGARDAKVTVVFFDDFQCPYCAFMYETLFDSVMKQYMDRVKVVIRDVPYSSIHDWAKRAAIDSNCLAAQNEDAYWEFSDYVHAKQAQIKDNPAAALDRLALTTGRKHNLEAAPLELCIKAQADAAVEQSLREATQRGIRGVPTLLINGSQIDGILPSQKLREILDRALREAGRPVPTPSTSVGPVLKRGG